MSSNDHKKFKTDATQKTSTDTEIISDTIVLPPYSTDHILTVTAPSSTSGLTGQVDVELEMSPDGENWCPALTEETTAGGGGASGVSEEDANLKAVSTKPDPGSTNTTATFTGNKFALGSLSYDASGNELTAGTGTRDFMHQFMSKDKPFNYSMWLKTDTANHPFQSGYTPTLFRHGGKDKFTNEKTVALTDTSTQNLSEDNTLPFANLFTTTSNLSISGWFKTSGNDTGTLFSNTGGAAATGLKVDISGSGITASYLGTANSTTVSGSFNDDQWHHIIMVMSSGSQLIVVDNLTSGTSNHTLVNDDLKGDNGFTLLGDGQENANNLSAASTDASKLQATLSNWSIHSEAVSAEGIAQLYSNGHVRNIKNLPGITTSAIEAWWQLNDATNPQNDLVGTNHLQYSEPVIENANTKFISGPSSTSGNLPFAVELVGEQSWFPSLNTGGANTMPGLHDAWTFSFWFNPSAVGSYHNYIWQLTTDLPSLASSGYSFRRESGTAYYWLMVRYPDPNTGNLRWLQSRITTTLTNGVWYYLTFVKSSGFSTSSSNHPFTIYINANPASVSIDNTHQGTANPSSTLFDNQTISKSGLLRYGHSSMKVGDIVTFNKALTSAEVSDLYANHNQPDQVTSIAANIDAHFRMGDGPNDILGTNWRAYDTTDSTPTTYLQNSDTTLYPAPLASYLTSQNPYEAGTVVNTTNLNTRLVNADGATEIVEEDQYGSGITMTLTKRFNTTTNEWTDVHTHPTCVCLSFNGLEDQAEYFAIYTYSEIDVADNVWHNLILSFSGKEGASTNATTNFSFSSTTYNFTLSIDGNSITEAHYVGGLGGSITNKSFAAQERHLKWDNNSEEDYMPHAQLNSNIFESTDQASQIHIPVKDRNYSTGFLGYADETSFHSESWFTASASTFNEEKAKTMFGNTAALSNRGVGTDFPARTPYPLRRPSVIGSSTATSNQYIDPEKYDAGTNADGGLEAWWRWGDTTGDCTVNINDAIGFESGNTDTRRSLNLNSTYNSEPNSVTGDPEDLIVLSSSDPIYVPEGTSSTGSSISLVSVILENIQAGVCNLKNLTSPILQYIRIKYTNSGEAQLGDGKVETSIHYRRRRER
jgi:hypothetical protein